jgi:HPr Serine kinase C-terminal domain
VDELLGVSVEPGAPGFHLHEPVVNRALPGGGRLVAERERAILSVSGVGTFAVERGSRISFQQDAEITAGALSVWLHGTVTALLLAQRGQFALHASVVEIDGRGVAAAGVRGAGKSTTALRLSQRGHALVTDDLSPLVTGDPITVHPYTRPVYVFAETAATLGLDLGGARPVLPEHPKLALAAGPGCPVPLGAIAVLRASNQNVAVDAAPVRGARAHWLVAANVYRADLLRELWETEMFAWAAEIAQRVPVHVVTRPANEWTADAVASAIEHIALSGSRSAP